MDYTTLSQLITSIGFPIICCIVMFEYMKEESKNHREEVNALKDSLKENTVVLADLKSMIKTLIDYMADKDE